MRIARHILIVLVSLICIGYASHFRGGTITWRPVNNTPSSSGTVDILLRQRYSWKRSATASNCMCTSLDIALKNLIGNSDLIACISGNCGSWTNNLDTQTSCTDFSIGLDVSSGEKVLTQTYPLNISFSIVYTQCCWFAALAIGSGGSWNVVNKISTFVRPDGYLNTSPVAVTLPIIYKEINIQHVHVVQMSDFDGSDILQCRWSVNSTASINAYDECADVCSGVLGATLIQTNCTIVFTLTQAGLYSAVALQIEDYYNSAATIPMSSVPLQFLFYGYSAPTGNCITAPAIIGNRPNRACIGTPIGSNVTEYVIVQTYCPNPIIDFVSSSPVGMTKSSILNPSPGIYQLILSWIPTSDQYGPQGFCAGAVDSISLQSNQWCITFLVGFDSPDVIRPMTVQGSASPIGTIFQNQTVFSIQTSKYVSRPTRNDTYIYFWDSTANNSLVKKFDCGWAPEVTYTGYTTVIRFSSTPWIPGHFYYVTFDSGVASGTEFCGPESAPITDPTFWVFNIWNPAVSSTTTTTTTPPTTGTVTTRALSTSTTNPLLTTTGIVIGTTVTMTTTTTTSTTSVSTTAALTSAGLTGTGATTESTVAVMYPKDFENACKQPIVVMTVVIMAAMVPLKVLAMYTAFTKFSDTFDLSKMNAKLRHAERMKKVIRRR